VIKKQTVEDWTIGFLKVKTMQVEQPTPNDPLINKITFIGNHKFGMVGLIFEMKDGRILEVKILPWAVL
jgi:hypothetical protein